MMQTNAAPAPSPDVMPLLQDLQRWRFAASLGTPVSLPAPLGVALLDLAVAALVAQRIVPNPQFAAQVQAVESALTANRATALWQNGQRLFAGRVHA